MLTALEVARQMHASEDTIVVQTLLRAFVQPLGYDRFVVCSASGFTDEVIERIYWIEGEWTEDGTVIDAESYVRHCPVARHVLETEDAFLWAKTGNGENERYAVVDRPQGPKSINGIQVPIFGHRGLEGAVSLGGHRIRADDETRQALIHVATAAFHAIRRIEQPDMPSGRAGLSEREREILAWTANGRRQSEIAATLGISERTVENHLRNARLRLGATTTVHTVILAVKRGEIEI